MHIRAMGFIEKGQGQPRQRCVCFGNVCFCDKCLYLFAAAVTVFAMTVPAALISMETHNTWMTIALTVLAGLSLGAIAFALGVNFVSAWKGKHYKSAADRSR